MERITGLASTIDDSLHIKREEIQKLEIVNKDLRNLSEICEFPNVLEDDLRAYRKMQEKSEVDYEKCFQQSIVYYESCFSKLNQFKSGKSYQPYLRGFFISHKLNIFFFFLIFPPLLVIEEPLIAPLYKESIEKIEEMRTILWNQ